MNVINPKILQRLEMNSINEKVKMAYSKFPRRLRERRKGLGLAPVDVEALTDISTPSLSNYENGRQYPGFERLVVLATLLNCSVDWLAGLTDVVNDGDMGSLQNGYASDVGSVSINIHTKNPKTTVSITIGGETILCLAEKLQADPGTHFTVEHFGGVNSGESI